MMGTIGRLGAVVATLAVLTPLAQGRQAPARRERIVQELAQLPPSQVVADPTVQAKALLAQKEFRDAARPRPTESALERGFRHAGEALMRWLGQFTSRPAPIDGLAALLRGILYALCAAASAVGVYSLLRRSGQIARTRAAASAGHPLDPLEDSPAAPMTLAHTSAAAGDWRNAIRYVYIAALCRLQERELLTLERGRTNEEYQNCLRPPEVYDLLLPATHLFDAVWYGQRPARAEEFETILATYHALAATEDAP